jgi:hypothetical protein
MQAFFKLNLNVCGYWLIQSNRVLLAKLIFVEMVNKLPASYGGVPAFTVSTQYKLS